MTLAAFAHLVGATPKWCQNALAALGLPLRYDPALARALGLARILHQAHRLPLRAALDLARKALAAGRDDGLERTDPARVATLAIDLRRYLTLFALRLAGVKSAPPRRAGRPPRPRPGGRRAAEAYGLDLGALRAGLRVSPAERLRALDANQRLIARLRSAGAVR
jgi:hypothetical protein